MAGQRQKSERDRQKPQKPVYRPAKKGAPFALRRFAVDTVGSPFSLSLFRCRAHSLNQLVVITTMAMTTMTTMTTTTMPVATGKCSCDGGQPGKSAAEREIGRMDKRERIKITEQNRIK
ncbi:unnamed protein product [Protopolystoma xenopodis]|uniref:Uncharacterized protein n=1 Tax=Protopolystoma xenopodis TaxID=117903 RepID=A0A3S5CLM6_9PLAT|nr:unnamed protein product [Protopolystoma xenopodis]